MTPPAALRLLALSKLHGLGNDFLIVLDDADPAGPAAGGNPAARAVDGALARRLCDRHEGIGADGLILGSRLAPARRREADSDDARLRFALWNADGSQAEMSGNGIRCLAHAALDAGWVSDGVPFGVTTPAGPRQVTIRRAAEPGVTWGIVDMGEVRVQGGVDRCNVGHGQLLVDVGNPHLVVLGPDPAAVDVATLGPVLEASDPAGLNVEFATLGPGPDEVTMRVWERGVGETKACGTGACAVAVALHHWGRVGRAVTVHQPGGTVAVNLEGDGRATLAGPSVHVAACVVTV
jgi:diaminopimelate epimerase